MPRLGWREFMVLVRGLGPNSALVHRLRSRRGTDSKGREVVTLTTTAAAEQAFEALFGPPKPKADMD